MRTSGQTDARQVLRQLESHWISLLLWLAEQTGATVDDLVAPLGNVALNATERRDRELARRGSNPPPFTVLHYVDFANYAEIANRHGRALESLGSPSPRWRDRLADQNRRGCVRYRNDLAHANRFNLLPPRERADAESLFQEQLADLHAWWPTCPFQAHDLPAAEQHPMRTALRLLSGEPNDAGGFAEELGMRAIRSPLNLIPPGETSGLATALKGYAARLFRVGEAKLDAGTAGLYLVYLDEWHERASQREKYRRRVARALVDQQTTDARWLAVLLDQNAHQRVNAGQDHAEVEFILPRTRTKDRRGPSVGTVRATVNPHDPSRYHLELLESLKIPAGASLLDLTRRWNEAFSVERVTKRFYAEFRGLRDRLVDALLDANPNNPAIAGRDRTKDQTFELQLNAFGTRQLSRLLFLWFLQQKRWLGDNPGNGSPTYLIDRFRQRDGADSYFSGVLVPIFFDGLGRPLHDAVHEAVADTLGEFPYLDGGLFRAEADDFEAKIFGVGEDGRRTERVILPDDLFDPAKDERETTGRRVTTRQRTALGLLRGYRFTTQESTPDDQSVDPDPELLGKVFENLYQEDDRHQTGAYYTPREIVHYMCQQTLDGYLRDHARVEQEAIDWLREEAVDWEASDRRIGAAKASALIEALENVTVLDPAVGSGAFLVGMLQEIVRLRRGIEQAERDTEVERGSRDVATWKRHAITHNLYGVDINPMAVEICRLRLWLSLVIDLEVVTFRDVPALPNLDFRIVAGDSLVDRMGAERFRESLPYVETQLGLEVNQSQRQIDAWQQEFDVASERGNVASMRERAERIRHERFRIVQTQMDGTIARLKGQPTATTSGRRSGRAPANAQSQLTSLERLRSQLGPDAPLQKPLLWPLTFPGIFKQGGFDIVVANPPYVRQESLDPVDQTAYQHAFPDVYTGTTDLYVVFFARAWQVLRDQGRLAFVTSNKYMRAAYGAGLRAFLPERLQMEQVIDFGDLPLFDVAAYPAVAIGQKVASPNREQVVRVADLVSPIRRRLADDQLTVNVDNVRQVLEGLPAVIDEHAVDRYPQALLRRQGWILEDPVLVRLFDRLMNEGTPLGEYVQGRMYYGIKTGLNDAFVIDQATRDALVAADPRSTELIKPWLRGRDIKQWKANWAGLYLIAIQNSGDADATNVWATGRDEAEARDIFRQAYPAIHDHMSHYEERLRPRADQGRFWWELRACAYYAEFEKPKVILPHFLSWASFCYDIGGMSHNNAASFCVAPRPGITGLLNSDLGWFVLSTLGTALQNGFTQMFREFYSRMPVPPGMIEFTEDSELLDQIVVQLGSGETTIQVEAQVTETVSSLFDLSQSERVALSNWAVRKRGLSPLESSADNES